MEEPKSESVCRLCQGADLDVLHIFEVMRFSEKIQRYLDISINEGDNLPMHCCAACINTVNRWANFYERVQENEARLQATVVKDTLIVLEETKDHLGYIEEPVEEDMMAIETAEEDYEELYPEHDDNDGGGGEREDEEEEELEEHIDHYAADEIVDEGVKQEQYEVETEEMVHAKASRDKSKSPRKYKRRKISEAANESFETREQQDEEIRRYASLECDVCLEMANTFEELLAHHKEIHNNPDAVIRCCDKSFKRRYMLLEHIKLHINPDVYACPQCHKRFSSKRHLTDHEVMHMPEEERQFQCQKCPKKYATRGRLTVHMRSHNEDIVYQCPTCEKIFKQEVILKNHIRSVHELGNQRICEICAKVFKTKEGFMMHQTQHMDKPPDRVKCEVCGGKYKNKDSLKYHMLSHTRGDERFHCDLCNKEFTTKKRMTAHKKYVHSTEKFPCTMCDKVFGRPIYLKEHMAAHTGEALYTCSFCPRTFNSNANKYSHQKTQHPVEWEMARQQKLEAD